MKALTASQMRDADRITSERFGVPGIQLMENAGAAIAAYLWDNYAGLNSKAVVVLCGKGNNGGDGLVVARKFHTRLHPRSLDVVLFGDPEELKGYAAANYRALVACGCPIRAYIPPEARSATVVVDALLGTGIGGPATG